MKIAMWSGPRNLSTAMMYAFGARSDCAVSDEPFYAAYLAKTGLDHPMRDEIIASQPNDPNTVTAQITGANPDGKPHWYQKHMAHHMLPDMPLDWLRDMENVLLLRHPARVIASYAAKRENPNIADIGFEQQAMICNHLKSNGHKPFVIDSFDIRRDPRASLEQLCDAIGLNFDPAMLSWPKGGHSQDGAWAPHWYNAVWTSTGFAGAESETLPDIPDALQPVLAQAMAHYEDMRAIYA
jgi:hypothetical protein